MAVDVPRRDYTVGFFEDALTLDSIRYISRAKRVTLFLGAGVSLDQGLPNWPQLVRGVLTNLLQPSMDDELLGSNMAEVIRDSMHQQPTATYIDSLLRQADEAVRKQARDQLLRANLYTARPRRVYSPSLVESVLRLAVAMKARNTDVTILTTNYDDLIEWAAANRDPTAQLLQKFGYQIVPYFSTAPEGSSPAEIPVLHIHGFLPEQEDLGGSAPVFSESDYASWDDHSSFRTPVTNALSSSTTIFVGSSLRDPNIVRALSLSPTYDDNRHFSLNAVEGESRLLPASLRGHWERFADVPSERGSEINVTVLRPDFFGQQYQYLAELTAAVVYGDRYSPYMERLSGWGRQWMTTLYESDDSRTAMTRQLRVVAAGLLPAGSHVNRIKLEIWVRAFRRDGDAWTDDRALELWASSQSTWLSGEGYWPKRRGLSVFTTDHPAVRAFAGQRVVQGRVLPQDATRWTHYVSAPLVHLNDEERLPLGSIVLLLHAPNELQEDVVPELADHVDAIAQKLARAGVNLLLTRPAHDV